MSALGEIVVAGARPMLIEDALPDFDAVRREHAVIPGRREIAWHAVMAADFLDAWRDNRVVSALFAARAAAERATSVVQGRAYSEPPVPESLRLADMEHSGEWVLLGEDQPREIAFGAIGRFWAGETAWLDIDADEFAAFGRPGFARIACNFSLRPYGRAATLVTYEVRTQATDDASRRAFLRYWKPLSPFIGVVMRAQLTVIGRETR